VQPSPFDDRDLADTRSLEYPGERLIACRNPFLAAERTRKREMPQQPTENELDTIVVATRRRQRALTSPDTTALRVGKMINRHKMGKQFQLTITDTSFSYQRNAEKIAAEAALDGIYITRTSVSEQQLDGRPPFRRTKTCRWSARLSQPENRRLEDPSNPSSTARSGVDPRVLVHLGLLRRVAHAPVTVANAV